ncbi:hypothetical protein NDU88_005549 [Pleurodeles waltl]|uniref:Uncharacterized protein n=1 Tax=Pleurodeles waltl TaxID=8319 RepID=A0AAV7RIV6_PLEWA|nr:hypothetical protein NDU88_005549 [Pleurodeles waltl]
MLSCPQQARLRRAIHLYSLLPPGVLRFSRPLFSEWINLALVLKCWFPGAHCPHRRFYVPHRADLSPRPRSTTILRILARGWVPLCRCGPLTGSFRSPPAHHPLTARSADPPGLRPHHNLLPPPPAGRGSAVRRGAPLGVRVGSPLRWSTLSLPVSTSPQPGRHSGAAVILCLGSRGESKADFSDFPSAPDQRRVRFALLAFRSLNLLFLAVVGF